MTYYKVLNADGSACHGGSGRWHLPKGKRPGKWMPAIPDPVPCERGYHLCRDTTDLLGWLGLTIWEAEARGTVIPHEDKVVVEQARLVRQLPWDERSARLFAADCAERVLPLFEAVSPHDDRPRRAIEAARAFADGQQTAAAWAAAWDAAWAAARAAARAAWASWAARDARDARTAAGAARDAAQAARKSERQWQTRRLAEYLGLT